MAEAAFETVSDRLAREAATLAADIKTLVEVYSSIERWNHDRYSPVIFFGGDFRWASLTLEGQRLQSELLDRRRRFFLMVQTLLRKQPGEVLKLVEECGETVTAVIEQTGCLYDANKAKHTEDVGRALERVTELLARLHSTTERPSFAPDTNALIFNPDLQSWRFAGAEQFEIVLLPAIAGELDRLKINHHNPDVREKAERVIRQIQEFRRRSAAAGGSLRDGAVIVRDVSTISVVAVEPDFGATFPWLDRTNDDDRFLAAAIELMRDRPRSAVVLVTRDINLQNKAEYAGLPFVCPPQCADQPASGARSAARTGKRRVDGRRNRR